MLSTDSATPDTLRPGAALDPDIATAVRAFAAAADARDLPALDAILHPDFRVLFTSAGVQGVKTLPRALYLQLAREGKVGGVPREVNVSDMRGRADLAWAEVRLDGAAATFTSVMTLARTDARWLVIEDATVYAPKG